MDGSWIGIVVDHLSELLVEYAEAADAEIYANPFQAKTCGIDLSSMSDSQNFEKAQTCMENLFRKLQ